MQRRTHTWTRVCELLQTRDHLPMRPVGDLVERIAASAYAAGLHPSSVMWSLVLYQSEVYTDLDEYIRVQYDPEAGEFVVQYRAGPFEQPYTVHPLESTWTRRDPDGFAAIQRCLEHLRWFTEPWDGNAKQG